MLKKKKKKNQQKDKSRKKQKVGHWMEKDNFVQLTLPHFLSHFLSILERLNCSRSRKKIARPHHFSLPLPLSTKHPFHSFFLLFSTYFFSSSLKSTHPKITLRFGLIPRDKRFWPHTICITEIMNWADNVSWTRLLVLDQLN